MAKTLNIDLRNDFSRNYIINGNFDIWQRLGANLGVINTATSTTLYVADRFSMFASGTSNKFVVSQKSAQGPTIQESGFKSEFAWIMTSQAAHTMANADDLFIPLQYKMEGYDYAGIISKTITLSFWTKSNLTGTQSISLLKGDVSKSYVTTFNIDAADVWQKVSITVLMEDDDSSSRTTGAGLYIRFGAIAGTGSVESTNTLDQWQNGVFHTSDGQVNTLANTADYIGFAQVQLNEGTEAIPFRRAGRTITEELSLCQRYYEKSGGTSMIAGVSGYASMRHHYAYNVASNGRMEVSQTFKVEKRISPTVRSWGHDYQLNTVSLIQSSGGGLLVIGIHNWLADEGYLGFFYDHPASGRMGFACSWDADSEL